MLYTDENLILRGHGFKEVGGDGDEKGQGTRLELNSWPVAVPSGSRLASYWPFIMFQNDDDNSFQWVRYWGSSADDYFSNRTLDVRGSVDSGMVVLPSSAWYLNNGGMVYRRSDGKMKTYESYSGNNVTDKAWGEGKSIQSGGSKTIASMLTSQTQTTSRRRSPATRPSAASPSPGTTCPTTTPTRTCCTRTTTT